MSSREFSEWIAYGRIYPIGEDRADARIASLMSVLLEIAAHGKKRFPPDTLMPKYLDVAEKEMLESSEEGKQVLRSRVAEKIKAVFSAFVKNK